jgi:hypothetical protein
VLDSIDAGGVALPASADTGDVVDSEDAVDSVIRSNVHWRAP